MEPQSQSKSRVSYQLKAAKKRRDYLVGTALLCGVIFLWVSVRLFAFFFQQLWYIYIDDIFSLVFVHDECESLCPARSRSAPAPGAFGSRWD